MKKLILFSVLLARVVSGYAADDPFEKKIYNPTKEKWICYRLHVPQDLKPNEKIPLVLFLHGAGERGWDNNRQMTHGVKDIYQYTQDTQQPAIIFAPQCHRKHQWVNTPWGADAHTMPKNPSHPMTMVMEILDELLKNPHVDTDRVYLTGISMGGFGTWDLMQRRPDLFAAAIPVCGGGDPAYANAIQNIPTWVFHGGVDKVVKTRRSRDMVAALKKAGGKPKYTEYEGVGHVCWKPVYEDKQVMDWLFRQRKGNE